MVSFGLDINDSRASNTNISHCYGMLPLNRTVFVSGEGGGNIFLDVKIFFLDALKNNRTSKKNTKHLQFNTKHLKKNVKRD